VKAWAALALLLASSRPARADELELRADVLGALEPAAGLLVLDASGETTEWFSAEAVVWAGAGEDDEIDALVIAVEVHDPWHYGVLRLGRFVETPGALSPTHLDGGSLLLRLPFSFRLEAFGGVPVAPDEPSRAYDWIAGGRVSRAFGDWGSLGLAYQQRRDEGVIIDHEVGADASLVLTEWLDAGGRLAWDLEDAGVEEAHASLVFHEEIWRFEAFMTERSPSRLLPSTSLFTVLGDVPSLLFGGSFRVRAAPRLDLSAAGGVRLLDGEAGESLRLGAKLRLDDEGEGAIGVEGRRERNVDAAFTGLRLTSRFPLVDTLSFSAEVELAIPDDGGQRGDVWPWGRVALAWEPIEDLEIAAAMIAGSSPQSIARFDGLARLSYSLEAQ
jgi:hypothetical protein